MKAISLGIGLVGGWLLATGIARAADEPTAAPHAGEVHSGDWAFTLTPRPWQRNPLLDMTAITEFTPAGRQLGWASLEHPIYYVAQDGGVIDTGETYSSEKRPSPAAVETAVRRALASTGYRPSAASTAHPRIAIVYHYGTLNQVPEGMSDVGGNFTLNRAGFIAGPKFADELAHKLFLGAALQGASAPPVALAGDRGPGGMPPDAAQFFDPVALMKFNTRENELLSQLQSDCYYVAISAYDYDALAHNRRVLLWRTKLTVDGTGVAMDESVTGLIAGSGPYVGQPTPDVAIFARRVDQFGRVDVGTPHPVQ